ncbi:MAG: sigma-70 family RNA polymerase sigma factor [Deltaproteobacteria bacterium]|nr:sigma-70 family RNA polymerase sigma factor [Deltaproteobacteria bacterium]
MEDIEIIKRIQRGDIEAYAVLVEKYHRQLLNFIYRITGDEKSVEDIGQEVFLSVYQSLQRFDASRGTPFSAWLFIIARNRCISQIRDRRGKATIPIDDIPDMPAPLQSAELRLIEAERQQALLRALDQLPEPYKSTILGSLRGDSIERMARVEGVSLGTVKSRLFRAREKIKMILGNMRRQGI